MGVKAQLQRIRDGLRAVPTAASFALSMPFMIPIAPAFRKRERPWVISGHRGRIYADNAAAVHQELLRQQQPVIWISDNDAVTEQLRAQNAPVLQRNSLRARWAMLTAPVLIHSHGESDIDLFQILLRRHLGLRVHVNHCMNHVKAGDFHSPIYAKLRGPRKWLYEWLVTDFDVLLASSESEKANFKLAYPKNADRIRLGGGAHMDKFLRLKAQGNQTNEIVYFPTFRDDAEGKKALEQVIDQLRTSEKLQQWLQQQDLQLKIGAHINTGSYDLQETGRISWLQPSEIVEAMSRAQAFISDYSGLIMDALLLDAPVIFFPFDLDHYLSTRWLYHPYEKLAYGPCVQSADALIDLLVSERWRDLEPWKAQRTAFRDEIIPTLEPTYAQRSVEAIREELAQREKA